MVRNILLAVTSAVAGGGEHWSEKKKFGWTQERHGTRNSCSRSRRCASGFCLDAGMHIVFQATTSPYSPICQAAASTKRRR